MALTQASEPLAPSPAPTAPTPSAPRLRTTQPATAPGERINLQAAPGVRLAFTADAQRLELSGPGVTPDLMADLKAWLASR